MDVKANIQAQIIYYPKSMARSTVALSALVVACLVAQAAADMHCTEPQKAFYLSYSAISKRDTMEGLFKEVDSKMNKFNYTYNDGKGGVFVISNLVPQLYYNEHHQLETYVDPQHVNVTLGDVTLAFRFDYSFNSSGTQQSGWARSHVMLDQTAYFIKRLLIKEGFLEWDPTEATNLTCTFPISIEYSEPTLQYEQKAAFELILNDHTGERKLKTEIMESINQHYRVQLKDHLNKEDIINTLQIKYSYKNVNINLLNAVKNYTLANNQLKGLEVFFFFEVENKTTKCTPEKIVIDQKEHGGIQEIYAISVFEEALREAAAQGLLTSKLDKKWEAPAFQFYMGDLANSIEYASRFAADDPFAVECKWDGKKQETKLNFYTDEEMLAILAVVCELSYKDKPILEVRVPMTLVVRILPKDDTLTFYIIKANIFLPEYKSLDPNFKVTDQTLARYSVGRVVDELSKTQTFGTGFKITKRKFPSVHVSTEYVTIYDPSEA